MASSGVWLLIAVLGAATAFGLLRRWSDGRFRGEPRPVPDNAPEVHVDTPDARHHGGELLSPAQLGAPLGERATVVQFSSAFCAPCRAARVLLDDVTNDLAGIAYIELDAELHLDLARHLEVRRTPTVFLLDAHGAIRNRASGLPRRAEVVAALGQVVSP